MYTQSCTRGFGCHWVPAYTGPSPYWYTHASNRARKVLVVTWCLQTRGFWLPLGAYRGMGKTPAPPHPPYCRHEGFGCHLTLTGEWGKTPAPPYPPYNGICLALLVGGVVFFHRLGGCAVNALYTFNSPHAHLSPQCARKPPEMLGNVKKCIQKCIGRMHGGMDVAETIPPIHSPIICGSVFLYGHEQSPGKTH